MFDQELKKFGLNNREIKAYLGLLEIGAATASSLAIRMNEHRTTTYSVLSNLVRKNLVSMDVQDRATYYIAENPQKIVDIVSQEKEKLSQKYKEAKELTKKLRPLYKNKSVYSPRVKIFTGESGMREMFVNYYGIWMKDVAENTTDKIAWAFRKRYMPSSKWSDWLSENQSEKDYKLGIKIRALSYSKRKMSGYEKHLEVKTIPRSYELSEGILWLCGDYIIMFYDYIDPPFGFMVHDHNLAQTNRIMLQFIWDHV